jgi:hypothetical protein
VDAGRLRPGDPAVAFADRSACTLLVSSARVEDLVQVPARVSSLAAAVSLGVLVVGRCAHNRDELAAFLNVPHVWLVDAPADLAEVAGSVLAPGRARRLWVWRQALGVAGDLAARAAEPREGVRAW